MKVCSDCGETKPYSEYNKHQGKPDGYQYSCRGCRASYNRQHYIENRQKYLDSAKRNRGPRYTMHGLSDEEYAELVSSLGNVCAICTEREATVIDHDHMCCPGKFGCSFCVRGIICSRCNSALGLFGDSIEALKNAVAYLGG